jgi:hypothetical protein
MRALLLDRPGAPATLRVGDVPVLLEPDLSLTGALGAITHRSHPVTLS